MARFLAKFMEDKCYPDIWKIGESKGEEREKAIEGAKEHLVTLENDLKGKRFFGGDEIGLVDITTNFIALWLVLVPQMVGMKLLIKHELPRLNEWIDNYLGSSIVKETLPARAD